MELIWLRVHGNVHFLDNERKFYAHWVTAYFTRRQFCGLDDDGIIINLWQGKSVSLSSQHPDKI